MPSSSMPLLEGVVAAVEGRVAAVVGTVVGAVVMLELGSAVSSELLPPHAVKRPNKAQCKNCNFFHGVTSCNSDYTVSIALER